MTSPTHALLENNNGEQMGIMRTGESPIIEIMITQDTIAFISLIINQCFVIEKV